MSENDIYDSELLRRFEKEYPTWQLSLHREKHVSPKNTQHIVCVEIKKPDGTSYIKHRKPIKTTEQEITSKLLDEVLRNFFDTYHTQSRRSEQASDN